MYLPVPLPSGLVRQTEVSVVSPSFPSGKKFLLEMTQADNVGVLKRRVAERMAGDGPVDEELLSRLQVGLLQFNQSLGIGQWLRFYFNQLQMIKVRYREFFSRQRSATRLL